MDEAPVGRVGDGAPRLGVDVCADLEPQHTVRSGGRTVERRTVNRGDGGSILPTAVSKLGQFRSPHFACVFRKRH